MFAHWHTLVSSRTAAFAGRARKRARVKGPQGATGGAGGAAGGDAAAAKAAARAAKNKKKRERKKAAKRAKQAAPSTKPKAAPSSAPAAAAAKSTAGACFCLLGDTSLGQVSSCPVPSTDAGVKVARQQADSEHRGAASAQGDNATATPATPAGGSTNTGGGASSAPPKAGKEKRVKQVVRRHGGRYPFWKRRNAQGKRSKKRSKQKNIKKDTRPMVRGEQALPLNSRTSVSLL